jgi:hypothetical protein
MNYSAMNKNRGLLLLVIAFFSTISAYGMTYGIVIIPNLLNQIIGKNNGGSFGLVIRATIGDTVLFINITTLCFIILLGILLFGYLNDKLYLSLAGTLAYFIPTLAHFTWGMGTFYGIGVLRVLWGPTRELNYLVSIINLPIRLFVGESLPISYHLQDTAYDKLELFSNALIGVGFFIIVFGIFNLLIGIFENEGAVSFWLYKYIRHPQYLGYILWSYGLYSKTNLISSVFGHSQPNPFTWVLSTLFIICIALREESILIEEKPDYDSYRKNTSFLIPLPKIISALFLLPYRIISGNDYPESKQDITLVFFIYLSCIILLSLDSSWLIQMET